MTHQPLHHPEQPQESAGGGVFSSYRPEGWDAFIGALRQGESLHAAYKASGVLKREVDALIRPSRGVPALIPEMAREIEQARKVGDAARKAARKKVLMESYSRPDWFDEVLALIEQGLTAIEALKQVRKRPSDVYFYTSPVQPGSPPRNSQMREDWERAQAKGRDARVRARLPEIMSWVGEGYPPRVAAGRAGVKANELAEFLKAHPEERNELNRLVAQSAGRPKKAQSPKPVQPVPDRDADPVPQPIPSQRPYQAAVDYLADRLKKEIKIGEEYGAEEGELFDLRIFLRIVNELDVTPMETTVPVLRDRLLKIIGQRYDYHGDLPEFLREGV